MVERLQTLVSSDGRFKNMRDALHRSISYCSKFRNVHNSDFFISRLLEVESAQKCYDINGCQIAKLMIKVQLRAFPSVTFVLKVNS